MSSSPRRATQRHRVEHMSRMKDYTIVGNIGHFDTEIDMAGLAKVPGVPRVNVKPQVDEWGFPAADGKPEARDHRARRGTAAEPWLRHGSPELRDVEQLHQPGDRADGALRSTVTSTSTASTRCRSTSTRKSRVCTSTSSACGSRSSAKTRPPISVSQSTARTSRITTATDSSHAIQCAVTLAWRVFSHTEIGGPSGSRRALTGGEEEQHRDHEKREDADEDPVEVVLAAAE